MFQKKQMIYSEELGLCRVENIVQLSPVKNGNTVEYYVLKPVSGREQAAYLPVKNHKQILRELFTREEALALQEGGQTKNNENLREAVEYVLSMPADGQ